MSFDNLMWEKTKWGEIASLEYGKALKDYKNKTTGYPVFGTNGPIGYTDKMMSRGPGVIIGRKGAYRGVHYTDSAFYVIDTAYFLKPIKNNLDLKWAYYNLKNTDINNLDSGSAIPSTSRSDFYALDTLLPSIKEQIKIRDLLSSLDNKIELNNAINKNLEEMAQALFKRWFIDFEFPNESGEPYKSDGGEFEESELGLIPKGWKVKKLEYICRIDTTSVTPSATPDETFELYSIPAYDEGKFPVFEAGSTIKSNKYKVNKGSVLISKLNPQTKRVWAPLCLTPDAVSSTEFINFLSLNSGNRGFLYSLLDSESFYTYLCSNTTGSTNSRQRVLPKSTLDFRFVFPDNEEVVYQFSKMIENYLNLMQTLIYENRKLAILRDTLLPKLMSGEIRVPLVEQEQVTG
ncbi:restriction endonuclease subunit S [Paenibacillus macerans]|nr:restriction endonuclease subunit S [Paenibacillus macerans]MCY7557177.1 restriction endonuclease subunit S [Paenibacillus macerans]MEC0152429.1 restriction endonuclease subunit S [Paenibacillus macerans]SUA83609.1 Predicted nucleotidyltransferases [Paenibacillus macerans]